MVPLAVVIGGVAWLQPVPAQDSPMRTLSVTGQGVEMIQTTLAEVSLGVEVQGATAEEAQQEAAQRTSSVVDFLRSRDIENLQTTGITLTPRYDYSNDTRRLTGYTATNIVRFRADIDQVGAILDEAVRAGATRIDGVSFTAEDEAIAAAQQEALRDATADAQAQADAVLDALGFSAEEIVGIQINQASPPPAPRLEMRAASFAEDATTPVVGGEQRVNASVTLQIRY